MGDNMNLIQDMEITHLAIHEISKDLDNNVATSKFGANLIPVNNSIKELLTSRLATVLGKGANAVQMECDPAENDSGYSKIIELLDVTTEGKIYDCSKELVEILTKHSTHRRILGGPIFIIKGTTSKLNRPFIAIVKAEYSSGFQMTTKSKTQKKRTTLQIVKDVFLTKDQKLFKVGFITLQDPSLDITKKYNQENLISIIYDVNTLSTQSSEFANYFYKKFLGLKFRNSDERLTEIFFNFTKQFIIKTITDSDESFNHLNHLYAYLSSPSRKIINIKNYINENIDASYQDNYRALISKTEIPDLSFNLDLKFITSELSKRTFVFINDNKVKIPYMIFTNAKIKFDKKNNQTIITLKGIPREQ